MRRFAVVLPLAPMAVGDVVLRTAWPPHVTLVGNATAPDGALDRVTELVRRGAERLAPIMAVVGPEARFGASREVRVDLVAAPALRQAHDLLVDELERHLDGFALDAPQHARGGYRPHRTVTAGPRPAQGTLLNLDAIVLVELEPPGHPGRAVVLARHALLA